MRKPRFPTDEFFGADDCREFVATAIKERCKKLGIPMTFNAKIPIGMSVHSRVYLTMNKRAFLIKIRQA